MRGRPGEERDGGGSLRLLDSLTVGEFRALSDAFFAGSMLAFRRELEPDDRADADPDPFVERDRKGRLRWLLADGTRPS